MVSIDVERVGIEFPVYQENNRSFRRSFLNISTGGLIQHSARERTVVQALHDISFSLRPGDRLGLIGRNGAGKTTLLRVLAQIYEPVTGIMKMEGKMVPLFDIGLGIDPDATGYENIMIRSIFLGIPPKEIEKNIESIAEFTGLGEFLNIPVRTYSAGMSMRLAFAISTSVRADILLMDEWFLAGDAAFLKHAGDRLSALVKNSSILVLASHSDSIVGEWCNKVLWLEHGSAREFGDAATVLQHYKDSF
jgi:ABC-type polysaccharide/polyol phosphate transport system ATPase subunit